jgi:hypothetical protein
VPRLFAQEPEKKHGLDVQPISPEEFLNTFKDLLSTAVGEEPQQVREKRHQLQDIAERLCAKTRKYFEQGRIDRAHEEMMRVLPSCRRALEVTTILPNDSSLSDSSLQIARNAPAHQTLHRLTVANILVS